MIDVKRFVFAIRWVESADNPIAVGDGGRAWTSIQCHPPWLWDWALRLSVTPRLGETWDEFALRVLEAYAQYHSVWEPTDLAMLYHKGHLPRRNTPDWDDNYAERFERAYRGLERADLERRA